ncbi:MAG TPA: hypothetical protein VEM35_02420, partial [Rhizomicrobium sp.]|nr:hypothetical protein [Rhizomicrobium sp.]
MKVELLSTCFLLTSAIMAGAVTVTMSPPPPAQVQPKVQPKVLPAPKSQAKVTCPCDCPNKAERRAHRHMARHYAENSYYHYWAAASVRYPWREWRRGREGRREEGLRIE